MTRRPVSNAVKMIIPIGFTMTVRVMSGVVGILSCDLKYFS